MAKTDYTGVYTPEGGNKPVALFQDADQAQQWRKRTFGADDLRSGIAPVELSVPTTDALFPLQEEEGTTPAPAAADAGAALESQVRGQLYERIRREELEKQLEADVRKQVRKDLGVLKEAQEAEVDLDEDGNPIIEGSNLAPRAQETRGTAGETPADNPTGASAPETPASTSGSTKPAK